MSSSTTRIAGPRPDRLKGTLLIIVASAVFWALASTLLFFLVPGLETYPRLLVFHECVGLTLVACALWLQRSRRFDRFSTGVRWLFIGLIAIPTGYIIGHQFAFLLLGEADNKFVVTLQPPAEAAAINQLHAWQVRVASPAGAPIAHARIKVDGGMPQHGHGLPTRPQVTQELSGGSYLIEGMKFSMTGWWEIKLAIESSAGSDKVIFNTIVSERSAGR
jgi:hypothetical protein